MSQVNLTETPGSDGVNKERPSLLKTWPLQNEMGKPVTVDLSVTKDSSLVSNTSSQGGNAKPSGSNTTSQGGNMTGDGKSNGVRMILSTRKGEGEIVKEGMAKCEQCGMVGVKHAFYTKDRNFCSPQCVKAVTKKTEHASVKNSTTSTKISPMLKYAEPLSDDSRCSTPNSPAFSARQETSRSSSATSLTSSSNKTTKKNRKGVPKQLSPVAQPLEQSFDWSVTFRNSAVVAAPVSCFKHVLPYSPNSNPVPVSHVWDNVTEGMKVEVRNADVNPAQYRVAFWVASVIRICGYNVLLRFEGFGEDASRDFWANLCTAYVHPVGWCATKGKPLMPPSLIASKYADWREFLVGRLTGARTLPQNLQSKVENALKSKFEVGTHLEVVDKNMICRVRLATVKSTIGKRLNMMYFDSQDNDDIGFWCHEDSCLMHPQGWAAAVGHEIIAPANYNPKPIPPTSFKFKHSFAHINLKAGMKLEVIDPLNLSAICAATVKRVLKYGYIMVRVDCYEEDPFGSDWFCHHVTSPNIFTCGFGRQNNITLTPPFGYDRNTFNWNDYFLETGTTPAKLYFFGQEVLEHHLKEGMKLEAADLMDPRLICVATVGRVVGSLLKIHFDGWEEEYDQWLDASSPDIYPVGYCQLVGHKLEKPPTPIVPKKNPKPAKKGRKKPTKRQAATSSEHSTERKTKETKVSTVQPVSASKLSRSQSSSAGETSTKKELLKLPDDKPKNVSIEMSGSNDQLVLPSSLVKKESSVTETVERVGSVTLNNDSLKDIPYNNESVGAGKEIEGGPISIPKLSTSFFNADMPDVDPDLWTIQEVGMFLNVNDCGTYCDSFEHNKVDGPKLLALTKDQIIVLTKMKVGPAVKILDLIGHLRRIANHARARKENKSKVPL